MTKAKCSEHDTIIEFRPLKSWKGEFGFDWMRVYEGEFTKKGEIERKKREELAEEIEVKPSEIGAGFLYNLPPIVNSKDGITTTENRQMQGKFTTTTTTKKGKTVQKSVLTKTILIETVISADADKWKFLGSGEDPYIDGASGAAGYYTHHPYTLTPENTNTNFQDYQTPTINPGRGLVDGGFSYDAVKKTFVDMNDGGRTEHSASDAKRKIAKPHGGGRGLQNTGGEYQIIRINRTGELAYRLKDYFIPYLNLFPEPAAVPYAANPLLDGLPPGITLPTPCCEAELQVLYDIKDALPGRLWIEYDPGFLEISGKGSVITKPDSIFKEFEFDLSQFSVVPTPEKYQDNMQAAENIKIKCLMNIEAAEGITLIVRAHQLGCRPDDLGSVAGALKICPNGPSHRAKLKVAFVEVATNIMNGSTSVTGELKNCTGVVEFFHGMHQALIVPDLINKETPTGNPYVLDLTNVPAFRHLSTKPSGDARPDWGKLIETNPNPQPRPVPTGATMIPNEQLAWNHDDFKKALKEEFKRQNPGPQSGGRILIFALGTEVFVKFDSRSRLGGICMREPGSQVDLGGYKIWSFNTLANVCLFKNGGTGSTLAHEIMHALSLVHTHRERWTPPNIPSNRTGVNGFRYIFPFETTTNIMSYNHAVSHSTWHWQWEAMQDFLRKCNHGGQ